MIDLVAVGEAPLYPTNAWVGRHLGRAMSLPEFLRIVQAAVEADVLRLWAVDAASGDRTELFSVPPDLASRYSRGTTVDESYDRFGLSVTLGAAADVESEPTWEVSLDFAESSFELILRDADPSEAIGQLVRLYPGTELIVVARHDDGGVQRVIGVMRGSDTGGA